MIVPKKGVGMKKMQCLVVAGLILGLSVGSARADLKDTIGQVKQYSGIGGDILFQGLKLAKVPENVAQGIVDSLRTGVNITEYGVKFGDNINGVKNSLGNTKIAFRDAFSDTLKIDEKTGKPIENVKS